MRLDFSVDQWIKNQKFLDIFSKDFGKFLKELSSSIKFII